MPLKWTRSRPVCSARSVNHSRSLPGPFPIGRVGSRRSSEFDRQAASSMSGSSSARDLTRIDAGRDGSADSSRIWCQPRLSDRSTWLSHLGCNCKFSMLGFASHQHSHFAIRHACSVSAVTEARVMVRRTSIVGVFTLATVVLAASFAVAQTGSGIAGVVKDAT